MTEQRRERLFKQLKRHEGRRPRVYRCPAGKLTIGYGRNLESKGLSDEEMDFLLNNDIKDYTELVLNILPWARQLNDARQDVLINMAFNLGTSGLLKFRRMLHHVKGGRYVEAAAEMLDSQWQQQVGPRAHELATQMAEGVYAD